jgi:hypothetical protein
LLKSIPCSKIGAGLSHLWLAAACLIPISMAAFVVAGYSPVQHLDQWEEIFWLKTYYAGEARVADLFRLHNRHPIFFPRLLYLIDIFLFRATNIFLIPIGFLIQASACALLVREVWIVPNLSRSLVRFLAGIYLIFLFSARQYGNFTWAFQVQFILVFAAPVAAAVFFARHADSRSGDSPDNATSPKWLLLCLICAIVSTFSMANGVLIWPALITMSLVSRQRIKDTIAIALPFVLVVGFLLLLGLRSRAVGAALSQPVRAFLFFVRYLGSPFSLSLNLAAVAGTVGLLLGTAFCLWYVLRPSRLNRFRIAHMTIIAFVLLSGVATSIPRFAARWATPLSSRYSTPGFIFWACVLSLLFYEADQWRRLRKAVVPMIICVVLFVFAVSIVPLHLAFGERAQEARRVRDEAGLALAVGVRNEEYLKALYPPDTEAVTEMAPLMQKERLSMFNFDGIDYIGKNVTSLFLAPDTNVCLGQFETAHYLRGAEDVGQSGVRAVGWAWDSQAEQPCPLVLLVDDGGVIRGIARSGYYRDDLFSRVDSESVKDAGWVGFATYDKGASLRAYAMTVDKSTACRLRGVYSRGN